MPRSHSQVYPATNLAQKVAMAGRMSILHSDVMSEEASWIQQNISRRVCTKFVIKNDKNQEDPECYCGYSKSQHLPEALGNQDTNDWKASAHTKTLPTDAYGEIEFMGFSQKISKYVRVEQQTDMDSMLGLLMDQWDLEQPNLLISVTGGAKNFSMKPRLKHVFRSGLMKAAQSTGAWIITGGMHAGVMKHVGEAVRDYSVGASSKNKVIALAVCPWGCVQGRQGLVDPSGKWPAEYRYDKTYVKKESPIDMNHSHFIMVDNGTIHQFGTEIAFRARLENAVSRMRSVTSEDDVKVPLVSVVLEGGPGTLETVKRAIEVGTPAVIVEGSGRAADILAYAYSASKEEEIEVTDQYGCKQKRTITIIDAQLQTEITKMIREEFGDRDLTRQVGWVRDCLQKRDLMTVFRLEGKNSAKDIDIAILQALLKANKDHDIDQLKLALAWNRIDVAKTDIFTEDKKWESGVLHDVMYRALLQNRVHFVKLFMENGVSLRDFLTVKRLLQLYNNIPENSLLYNLLRKIRRNKSYDVFTLEDVGNLIQDLMGDFYSPLYLRDQRYTDLNAEQTIDVLKDGSRMPSMASIQGMLNQGNGVSDLKAAGGLGIGAKIVRVGDVDLLLPDFDEPTRELFIWSVLLNRQEMSSLFWDEGKDGIAAALTGMKLTTALIKSTDDSELEKSLLISQKKFDELSCGVVAECYAQDEQLSQLMLVRELPNYGNSTIIQMAVQSDNKTFVAHPACQTLLHNIWRGRMTNDNGWLRIFLCVIFPPLVWLLIKFRGDGRSRLTDEMRKEEYKKQEKRKRRHKKKSDEVELISVKDGQRHGFSSRKSFDRNPGVSFCSKIIHFFNAPLITFIYNCLSYIVFLGVYSFILLTAFNPPISIAEIILIVWVFSLFAEELRQLLTDDSTNFRMKLTSYLSDPWNVMDVITIVLFITGMVLRGIPDETCFDAARIILALDLMCFFFRILHMFSVHRKLGPKLVMIGQMMIDLIYFIIILMVFIVAYGLAMQAILYPNSPLEPALVQDVLRKAYWQMYGELFLEELEGQTDCTFDEALYSNNTLPRCPANTWVGPLLLGVYIMLTNVLMLNLLIAMFSFTFNEVQENTDAVWKFQHYALVLEYFNRPPIPPPLIVLSHIYLFCKWCAQVCCKQCISHNTSFKMTFTDTEVKQILGWENINADEYLRKSQLKEKNSTHYRVKQMHSIVDSLANRVEEIADQSLMLQTGSANNTQAKLPPQLDNRLSYLEEQMQRTAKALDFIVTSLVEKNMAAKSGPPNLPDVDKKREEEQKKREEQSKQEKELMQMILKNQLELHVKARSSPYPATTLMRFSVPDEKVPWNIEFSEYEPITYTSNSIRSGPWYADKDIAEMGPDDSSIPFNDFDPKTNVNRKSYCGEYQVKDGYPLNPRGRTGMNGRGMLGRWGPNHAGDPIVTRWKRKAGEIVRDQGKKVLEFVAIMRTDNKQWAIPGGILDPGKEIHSCLKAEFKEEALGTLMDEGSDTQPQIQQKLDVLFKNGKQIYQGYMDDPRNTDNAWLETTAVNYHDEEGSLLDNFVLRAGEQADVVRWQMVSSRQSLYGGHLNILQTVANELNAAF